MFDTITLTKAFGSLCAALLVFMFGKTVADAIYVPVGRNLPPAFVVDTGVETDETEQVAELSFDEAFAVADASAGTRLWGQCRACHVVDDARNSVGPYLQNVMGREIGGVDGFRYSGALPAGVWTAEAMSEFLRNPRTWAPGTSMSYAGMASVTDRANLIAYIATFSPDWEWDGAADQAAAEPEAPEDTATEVAEAPEPEAAEPEAVEPEAAEPAETEVAEAPEAAPTEPEATEPEAAEAAEAEAPEAQPTEVTEAPETPATEPEATDVAEAPEPEAAEPEATDVAEAPEAEAAEPEATETAEAAPEAELSPIAAAVAAGDVAAGARVFRQCAACHVVDQERNLAGPHLAGVIGREIGVIEGFRYSGNLPRGVWTLEELDAFLTNPRAYAPRTSMSFNGLRNEADRVNVLAFIASHD